MTLIEYLTQQAAELRGVKVNENGRSGVRVPSSREWALAKHVEEMLRAYEMPGETPDYYYGLSHALESLATCIATVTGTAWEEK